MSNETIFWAQVASLITFIFAVFGLYRLLVDQKEATIQMLRETVSALKERLAEAQSSTPDVLAQSLSNRIKLLESELARLSQDRDANQEVIQGKEEELLTTQKRMEELQKQVLLARVVLKDFRCPDCRAPLASRQQYEHTIFEEYGYERDVKHDECIYECGCEVLDGAISRPCPKMAI